MLDGIEHRIKPGFAILVPAGASHNIIYGASSPMKLYTLYALASCTPPRRTQRRTRSTSTERRPNSHLPDNCSGEM